MGDSFKKLIKQNPVNRGLDYGYLANLLCERGPRYFPGLTGFKALAHEKHKRRVGAHSSTFIYTYTLTAKNEQGKTIKKYLVYSAHSDESRKRAYDVLSALIRTGFNKDAYRVMVPLEYLPELKALVYERVPGNTLLHYVRRKRSTEDLLPLIKRAARWLQKFHTFALPPGDQKRIPVFKLSNVNWTVDQLQSAVDAADAAQGEKLKHLFKTLDSVEKKLRPSVQPALTYGDLHPENIITDRLASRGLTMIDFTDVAIGDPLRDIGSFIQQFEFMARGILGGAKIQHLSRVFIETYFSKTIQAVSPKIYNRINLYQGWSAFRGFVYFFFNKDTRKKSYGLLEDSFRYLYHADHDMRTFTIKY